MTALSQFLRAKRLNELLNEITYPTPSQWEKDELGELLASTSPLH